MTTSALVVSGCIAAVLALLALGGTGLLARLNRRLDNMMEARDVFFRAARILLSEEETPRLIVDQLEVMANTIDSPRLGRMMFISAFRGELRRQVRNPSQHALDIRAALSRMKQELRRQYSIAVYSYVMAATFTNTILGTFIRRALLFWITGTEDEPQGAEIAITDVASICDQPRELVA